MDQNHSENSILRLSAEPKGFGVTADELSAEMFTSELPTQHTHLTVSDDDQGLYVGVWDTDDMSESPGAYPCDEFMVLLEGEARIKNTSTGHVDTVYAGEAFVLPKGFDCQWIQQGYLKKFFMISEHPEEPIPATPASHQVLILKGLGTEHSTDKERGKEHSANPIESIAYTDTRDRFIAGSWHATEYSSPSSAISQHQLCYVKTGTIVLTDTRSISHNFSKGDAFYIPADVAYRTDITSSVVLFFCRLSK